MAASKSFLRPVLLISAVVAFSVFILQSFIPDPGPKDPGHAPKRVDMGPRMDIRGFHYYGYGTDGRKVISFQGDRFSVEKKKLGFFRTALADEIIVRNAVIDLYGERTRSRYAGISGSKKVSDQNAPAGPEGLSLKGSLSKEVLSSFSVKRPSAILLRPIRVSLYDGKSLVTSVSASSATVRPVRRDVVFRGDVQVTSGQRTLYTEELIFETESALFRTDHSVRLLTSTEKLNGSSFSGDIRLNAYALGSRPVGRNNFENHTGRPG